MTDRVHKSLLALVVVLTFGAALAWLLAVVSVPREREFESDGWQTETFPQSLGGLVVPPGSLPFKSDDRTFAAADIGGIRPNQQLTPGAIFKEATLAKIKKPGYAATIRDVPESEKRQVAESYGVTMEQAKSGEFDHLVPCALGGGQGTDNIWWQPGPTGFHATAWNFKVKDRLEKRALKMVRDGELDLRETQKAFASDWVSLYRRLFNDGPKEAAIAEEEQ